MPPNRSSLRFISPATMLAVMCLSLAGCATRLAPDYDKSVINGLTTSSEDVMTFFASIAGGTKKEDFSTRKPTYDRLIGKLDALGLQATARPVPRSQIAQLMGSGPDVDLPADKLRRSQPASVPPIVVVVQTLEKMRDTDAKQGLTSIEVAAFKGNVIISMDQALTYEKALER